MFGIPTHLLAKVTLTETTFAVTLSVNPIVTAALSFTPRHLVVRINTKCESSQPSNAIQFNGDSGSNYNRQHMQGSGTSESSGQNTSGTSMHAGQNESGTNEFGSTEILIPDAFSTRTHKATLALNGATEDSMQVIGGRWENTAAITSVRIFTSGVHYSVGSTFELAVVDEAYVIDETINTGAAQFDHASISAADGDLVIIGNLRSDVASHIEEVSIRFNNDTGGNYIRQRVNASNGTNIGAYASTSPVIAHSAAANADANSFSGLIVQVPNFSDGSNDRNALTLGGGHFSDSDQIIGMYTTRWNNTTAINRVAIYGKNASTGFLANSMLSIYAVPKGQITRTELSGSASSVAFTSIPQTYDHLELTAYMRDDRSATSDDLLMSLTPVGGSNDTTDANYDTQLLQGAGSTDTATTSGADRTIGNIAGNSETANVFGVLTITLYNYTKTDRHKHSISVSGRGDSATGVYMRSNRWENTAAIEAITLTPSAGSNFLAGSVVTLRGINPPPAASTDIETINGIASTNIEAVN